MINNDFLEYEEALDLKELGFDEPCFGFYRLGDADIYYGTIIQRKNHKFRNNTELNIYGDLKEKIAAPTYSQAFRWFREKLQIDSGVYFEKDPVNLNDPSLYRIKIHIKIESTWMIISDVFDSHSKAELECLRTIIGILKASKAYRG